MVRSKRVRQNISSSLRICSETADCDRPTSAPVREKLPVSARARKVRSTEVSTSCMAVFIDRTYKAHIYFAFLFSNPVHHKEL